MSEANRTALRIQLLGPVRAWRGEREIELGGPQRRAVLAMLASARDTVSLGEAIDGLWAGHPPASAENAVHVIISGLRRALEPSRAPRALGQLLTASGPAYRLRVPPGSVDTETLSSLVADARRLAASDPAAAVRSLDGALALWRGASLSGIPGPWAVIERVRLDELRQAAIADRLDLLLALGSHHEVVAELAALIRQYPLRERLRGQLMLALYRCGRQAEALAVFAAVRREMAVQLGIDPGPALRRLHEQILAADPALDLPRPRAGGDGSVRCANCSGSAAAFARRPRAARRCKTTRRRPLPDGPAGDATARSRPFSKK